MSHWMKFNAIMFGVVGSAFVIMGIIGIFLKGLTALETLGFMGLGVVFIIISFRKYKNLEVSSEEENFAEQSRKPISNASNSSSARKIKKVNPLIPKKSKSTDDLLSIQNKSREVYRQSKPEPQPEPKPSQSKPEKKSPLPPKESEPVFKNIFISYRRSDSADVTGRIYDKLLQDLLIKNNFSKMWIQSL